MDKFQDLRKLFWVFFKIGLFTFGGGYAMLPLIQKEAVERRRWVAEEEILDVFAISQSIPGIISVNSAIFIGNKVAAFPGAVVAALGMILPAFISILAVLIVLSNLRNNVIVEKVLAGIRAASAALILLSAVKLGRSNLKNKTGWIIAAVSFSMIVILNINAAWAVAVGGMAGYAASGWNRGKSK